MPDLPEPRGAFGGFIGPQNLLTLVANTAPWVLEGGAVPSEGRLNELAPAPLGWRAILLASERVVATEEPDEAQWTDYFALCVAAHFATVMTYVPTDVDTKIRDQLWYVDRSPDELVRRKELALALAAWDVSSISRRRVMVDGVGAVSGHDGERLSVLCGGILGLSRVGDEAGADELTNAVDAELTREARAFAALERTRGREVELLQLATVLTHNAGDVDQGLSARKGQRWSSPPGRRFGRLAHEREERYGGVFARAAALYKALMAGEGHRNYPLREVRCLRSHPDLLLPFAPFLDQWGASLATSPLLSDADRTDVVLGLVTGVRKVRGQRGYQRALAGFDDAYPGGLSGKAMQRTLPASARRALRDTDLRRDMAVRPVSFTSGLAKRARDILARHR